MSTRSLIPTAVDRMQQAQLQADWQDACRQLVEAEAELAQEQAAVNAFRMQCRLKIGHLIDDYLLLQSEKQALWTRLQLLQQAQEFGIPYDADDPFWHGRDEPTPENTAEANSPLPDLKPPIRDKAAEKRLYRELARRFHPDLAANSVERAYMTAIMATANVAYQNHDMQTLQDLSDEVSPTAVARLQQMENQQLRKLQEQIFKAQRRCRRAQQQLKTLRQENSARLWRRAEALKAEGRPWWEVVHDELLALLSRRHEEIAALKTAVAQAEATAPQSEARSL